MQHEGDHERVRVLVTIHHRYAGLGVCSEPVAADGHELVEWMPGSESPPSTDGVDALIVLGGRARLGAERAHPWLRAEKHLVRTALRARIPVLGVCLGAQVLATVAGGVVRRAARPEIGWHEVRLTRDGAADPLLGALPERFHAFEWHHDKLLLPPKASSLARSAACLQAFRLLDHPAWGVQFHPEARGEDLGTWLDGWQADRGAVLTGLDPEEIRRETATRIAGSNERGRLIVERFIAEAARLRAANAPVSGQPSASIHRPHAEDEDALRRQEALQEDGQGQDARPALLYEPQPREEERQAQAPPGPAGGRRQG
jgi:GMP synthase-like glutamine amidotransferase